MDLHLRTIMQPPRTAGSTGMAEWRQCHNINIAISKVSAVVPKSPKQQANVYNNQYIYTNILYIYIYMQHINIYVYTSLH